MRPHPALFATSLTRSAPAVVDADLDAVDRFAQLARALAPVERAAVSAALHAIARRAEAEGTAGIAAALADAERALHAPAVRNEDLFYLPFMAVYPGDDELA